ncbi:MAG: hypothetical protein OXD42_02665 [Rhodospirillaceae bacterium]|nr:hypothetical protein [Rhodospirillaceae bacterium]
MTGLLVRRTPKTGTWSILRIFPGADAASGFSFGLRNVRRREGRYLLRADMVADAPAAILASAIVPGCAGHFRSTLARRIGPVSDRPAE